MKTPKFVTIVVSAVVLCIHRATAFAAPETATPLTYEMMAKSIYKKEAPTVFPEEVKKLEGKRVKVFGSAVPDDDPEKMFKFLMLKAVVGCFYAAAHQDLWKGGLSPDATAPYHAWLTQ